MCSAPATAGILMNPEIDLRFKKAMRGSDRTTWKQRSSSTYIVYSPYATAETDDFMHAEPTVIGK